MVESVVELNPIQIRITVWSLWVQNLVLLFQINTLYVLNWYFKDKYRNWIKIIKYSWIHNWNSSSTPALFRSHTLCTYIQNLHVPTHTLSFPLSFSSVSVYFSVYINKKTWAVGRFRGLIQAVCFKGTPPPHTTYHAPPHPTWFYYTFASTLPIYIHPLHLVYFIHQTIKDLN